MEIFAQWLDDLDDLVYSLRLLGERWREILMTLLAAFTGTLLTIGGVLLALKHPPMAMAVAILLFVTMLYRAVTSPRLEMI